MDLLAKQKIKEATEMAARAQKQNAVSYKKKLEEEASKWVQRNKKLQEEEKAAELA